MPVPDTSEKNASSYRPNIIGRLLLHLLVRLPVPYLAHIGRGFGLLFYLLDRKRKHFARVNLELCFPDLDTASRRRLLREHFKAMGQGLFATLGITWVKPRIRLKQWVQWKNKEIFDQAVAENKRIIVLAPHFVGLELAIAALASEREFSGMYRPPRHNILHWAIDLKRRQFGGEAIGNDTHLKKLIRIIKSGIPFYYLPDLDQGRHVQFEFAPFFGHPAATVTALSRLVKLTDAVVLPCVARQGKPGEPYVMTFHSPFENFPGPSLQDDVARLNGFVEEQVRTMPEQYFWIHRRFKTRPDNGISPYKK